MFSERMQNNSFENPDEKIAEDFGKFISENKFTADNMREAYDGLYGDENNKNLAINKIVVKMKEITENGFSLNRLVDIINSKQEYEQQIQNYYQYIEKLNITPSEKRMLNSIVKDQRTGTLECYIGDEMFFSDVKKVESQEDLASTMITRIKNVIKLANNNRKKYGFIFVEN